MLKFIYSPELKKEPKLLKPVATFSSHMNLNEFQNGKRMHKLSV